MNLIGEMNVTREQQIARATHMRKGMTTAIVALDDHERRYTKSTKVHDSLNQAKHANGPSAVSLRRGEHFPPTLDELPVIEDMERVMKFHGIKLPKRTAA